LHEGTFRFEIGNMHMKAEQNANTEVNINYESNGISLYTAAFVNRFRNYIYLAPTGTELYGFDIYRFLQANATLYGGEAMLTIKPLQNWAFSSQYATVTGKLENKSDLPFIPADKWTNELTFSKPHIGAHTDMTWQGGAVYVFAQHHPGAFETATPGYLLVNTSVRFLMHKPKKDIRFSVAAENLLNKRYYDHLSRFKYFGIYNTGRNVMLSLSLPLKKTII
jgi:iron complex outermembrane receptor protein